MKLQITQNDYGNYSFSRDEKSTVFSMVIKDDNGVVKVGEIPCRLQYSSDTDETYDFENAVDNLEWVFEKCFNYSKNVWSSTDYTGQCLAFAEVYKKNFETIKQNYLASEEKRITDEIESLKKKLANLSFEESDFSYPLKKRIETIERHISSSQSEMTQYVEGSEKKQKCLDQIKRLEEEKKRYEELITVYVFTREVKRWGVEAGDYYNPDHHMIVGGKEKLLADGVIEIEE